MTKLVRYVVCGEDDYSLEMALMGTGYEITDELPPHIQVLTREQVLNAIPHQIQTKYPSIVATMLDNLFGVVNEEGPVHSEDSP